MALILNNVSRADREGGYVFIYVGEGAVLYVYQVVPSHLVDTVLKSLLDDIAAHNSHLTTGL